MDGLRKKMATTPLVLGGLREGGSDSEAMGTKSGKRKRCRFIDDQACEEDEKGREVRGRKNDEDGEDAPNEEDLAFINDEEEDSRSSEDKQRVRISREEKELTEEDLELIQTNAGIIAPRVVRAAGKRRFKRLERVQSSRVYKDSDEDDVHTSDEDFIESDSESSDASDSSGGEESPPVARGPVLRAIPVHSVQAAVSEEIAAAGKLLGTDKFWREEVEPQACDSEDEEAPPQPPVRPAVPVPHAVIFQQGFKSSVLAPAKAPKPAAKKAPAKRPPPKRPEWDADQPGYVYNRATGRLMYRDAAGNTRDATGVDPI